MFERKLREGYWSRAKSRPSDYQLPDLRYSFIYCTADKQTVGKFRMWSVQALEVKSGGSNFSRIYIHDIDSLELIFITQSYLTPCGTPGK